MVELTIDTLDFLQKILKYKLFIITCFLICTILAAIYAFLAPEYFSSQALIKPISQELLSFPSSDFEYSSMTSSNFQYNVTSKNILYTQQLIKTRKFAEKTIRHFDLINYFEISEEDPFVKLDKALKLYNLKLLNVAYDQEIELIRISAVTKDKVLSRDIVQFQLDMLSEYNENENVYRQRSTRLFLEKRIAEVLNDLDVVDLKIKELQSNNDSYLLEEKVHFALKNYSNVFMKKLNLELKYELAKASLSESNQKVEALANEIDISEKQLLEFENSETDIGVFKNLNGVPQISYEYNKLVRKQEVLEQIYEYLVPIYEVTKINELKSIESFEIVDFPRVSGLRAKPKRTLLISFVALMSIILACTFVVLRENYIEYSRLD